MCSISPNEILKLYYSGYTVKRLIGLVQSSERVRKCDATAKVESVIYNDILKSTKGG